MTFQETVYVIGGLSPWQCWTLNSNETKFVQAVLKGCQKLIQEIVDTNGALWYEYANISIPDTGESLLMLTVMLLDRGVTVNDVDRKLHTTLYRAISNNQDEIGGLVGTGGSV